MITSEHVSRVVHLLGEWQKGKDKLVVGIDGYSGAGKTTLLNGIGELFGDALLIHRDDFIIPREEFDEQFQMSKDKVRIMEYGAVDVHEIRDFIGKYRESNEEQEYHLRNEKTGRRDVMRQFNFSKSILIMEGIFLFHPKQFGDLFDRKIFLDIDQEEADKRRREREMRKWGADYFPDTHPDSYFRLTKIAFNDYIKKHNPLEKADVVLRLY